MKKIIKKLKSFDNNIIGLNKVYRAIGWVSDELVYSNYEITYKCGDHEQFNKVYPLSRNVKKFGLANAIAISLQLIPVDEVT
jgi:hypothetical protein